MSPHKPNKSYVHYTSEEENMIVYDVEKDEHFKHIIKTGYSHLITPTFFFQPVCLPYAASRKEENGVWGYLCVPFAPRFTLKDKNDGLRIPLRSLWPTLHCRQVAGVSLLLSIGLWYLSSVSPNRHCCWIIAADKGWRVYPLDPHPDAISLYSGCTPVSTLSTQANLLMSASSTAASISETQTPIPMSIAVPSSIASSGQSSSSAPATSKKELIEWCMKEGLIASSYECPKCNDEHDVTWSAIKRFLRNCTSHAECMFDHYLAE
ncbi:uncharacterized protein TNCV_1395551 [Trichonephila clavipes]|nr:uncharacterized protein TNCV_1395551 [Trichonephila clavipes]